MPDTICVSSTVSYTHLDVYKRQPIELIEYPINNPKDYKLVATIPGFPKQIPSFAKNIYLHSNPPFLQGGSYVQLAFGSTPDQLKPYIEEARIDSKVVISKSDLSNVYVKNYVDSNMEYADTLKTLLPTSIVIVKNTTVPMGLSLIHILNNSPRWMRSTIEKVLDVSSLSVLESLLFVDLKLSGSSIYLRITSSRRAGPNVFVAATAALPRGEDVST